MFMKLFNILIVAWPVSEVILGLFARAKRRSAAVRDRGSLALLWIAIAAGLTAANFIRISGVGSIGTRPVQFLTAASVIIVLGLALRWTAIITLGRFFTANVAVLPGHAVVRTGVYRYVRHPAYSGLILAQFLGHRYPDLGRPAVPDTRGRNRARRGVGKRVPRLRQGDEASDSRCLLARCSAWRTAARRPSPTTPTAGLSTSRARPISG
jgi:protein-S-isoprenylcysteine O-methyltransferase Ste14